VVCDLDGTLFDNRPRTLQILIEYADEVRDEYPDVAEALTTLQLEGVQYLLSDTLRECGLTHVEIVRDISLYWRERFYSEDYLTYDEPFLGATDYVNACHDAGATIVYVTNRDVPGMLLGTVASLREHGLPIGVVGVELVLKPDASMGDEAFKRMVLPTLTQLGDVVGFFDNEPANCNIARSFFPDAEVALLETQKVAGAPTPEEGVAHVSDFRIL